MHDALIASAIARNAMNTRYCWLFLESQMQLEGECAKDKFVRRLFFD